MIRVFAALILTLPAASSAYAEARVYLIPRVEHAAGGLSLSRIARVETFGVDKHIGDIFIGEELYEDGRIDRDELTGLIRKHYTGPVSIYGNGVAVNAPGDSPMATNTGVNSAVKKGKTVRFVVRRNGISVEAIGQAMGDGRAGDIIPVRLDGGRTVNGTVINSRLVVVRL